MVQAQKLCERGKTVGTGGHLLVSTYRAVRGALYMVEQDVLAQVRVQILSHARLLTCFTA
eukprot:m.271617 g.271617  ORF g.271617 m.271617 type:complete len:60 (-) comp15683_c12_seq1:2638-2817(-)